MKKVQNPFLYLALSVPTSIPLLLYGYLGSFTRYIADDYCSATYAQKLGRVQSILYWYRTWSGRYSAFGMDWLVLTGLSGRYGISMIPPAVLMMWLVFASATIYLYLKTIAPESKNFFPAIVLAASSIYLILLLSPNVPQSFYWWNGMRSYTLPIVVFTAYAFFFQLISKQGSTVYNRKMPEIWGVGARTRAHTPNFGPPSRRRQEDQKHLPSIRQSIVFGIVAFFLLFASGGLSETFAVLQFVLLVFLLFLKFVSLPRKGIGSPDFDAKETGLGSRASKSGNLAQKFLKSQIMDPQFILLLGGLLGSVFSLLVIIAAPGNAIRQGRLNSTAGLADLVSISLSGYAKFIIDLFNQGNKWTGILGAIFILVWVGTQYKHAKLQPRTIFACFVAGLIISFACIPPGVYGYSQMPPARTMILPVFGLVVFTLVASFFLGNWLSEKGYAPAWTRNGLFILACAFIIFSGLTTSLSLYGNRNVYINYAKKWDAVDAQILQAKAAGKESVEVPDMSNWSGLDRPNQDPGFWLNECYTDLYGIEVIGPIFLWQ